MGGVLDIIAIPFDGECEPGLWQVTFTLASGEEYEGEFTIYIDGLIVLL